MALNKEEIGELLGKEKICFVATTRPGGRPHIVPIWFIYHNGKIYFETDETTVKFRNIQNNNKVALCFGGRETYIVEGSVKWYKENEAPVPFRAMFWDKYGDDMDDSYVNENTLIFEIIPEKELSWHYADQDWE